MILRDPYKGDVVDLSADLDATARRALRGLYRALRMNQSSRTYARGVVVIAGVVAAGSARRQRIRFLERELERLEAKLA